MATTKPRTGQIQSQIVAGSNSGNAGGSLNYLILGNLVIMWGTTASFTANTGATVKVVTYPFSFASVPTVVAIPRENTVSGSMLVYQEGGGTPPTVSDVRLTVNNSGSNGTVKLDWIAIGSI